MGSKKKAGPAPKRVRKYVPVPEVVRPQTLAQLGQGCTDVAPADRKKVLKYIRWCFEQDPVGCIRLFTKGL